jgi:hypothetical protein
MQYDAEERDLPAVARPTRDHLARTVQDKFLANAAANAIPTHAQLPRMHWRSMAVGWGTDDAEELEALRARFGAEPARLRTDAFRNVSRQKAAGVDTVTNTLSGGCSRTDRRRQSRQCYSPSHRCAWQALCIRTPWTSYKQDALHGPTGSSRRSSRHLECSHHWALVVR